MSIIVSRKGEPAKKIDKTHIVKEKYLQEFIHQNPEAIPVYEIEEDKKLLVVAREFPTESGPIDALAIDKDGDIYIVETKLYKNPDKRKVVAQSLDYGASLWKHFHDFRKFLGILDKGIATKFATSFEEKAKAFFELDGEEFAALLEILEDNLKEGNFKFVVLMDELEDRLKDLILFVNQNSSFDIFAVELEYYNHDQFEIVIPRLFGTEVKKRVLGSSSKRKVWNEVDFTIQVRERLKEHASHLLEIYSYLKKHAAEIHWGTGTTNGSFTPIVKGLSETRSPFSFFSDGTIHLKFSWFLKSEEKQRVLDLAGEFIRVLSAETRLMLTVENLLNEKGKVTISSQEFSENYEGIFATFRKIFP